MKRNLFTPAGSFFFALALFGQTATDASRQSFHITPLKPVEELRRDPLESCPLPNRASASPTPPLPTVDDFVAVRSTGSSKFNSFQ
jgi:hypothetical protein